MPLRLGVGQVRGRDPVAHAGPFDMQSPFRPRSPKSKWLKPVPEKTESASASLRDRMPAGATKRPAGLFRAIPAVAFAKMSADWAKALRLDRSRAVRENSARPSLPVRNRRSGQCAAQARGGRHRPARHKREARYFLEPIHTS